MQTDYVNLHDLRPPTIQAGADKPRRTSEHRHENAWNQFYLDYRDRILAQATREQLSPDEANDAAQRVLMAVLRKYPRFTIDPETRRFAPKQTVDGPQWMPFGAWIGGVIKLAIRASRPRSKSVSIISLDAPLEAGGAGNAGNLGDLIAGPGANKRVLADAVEEKRREEQMRQLAYVVLRERAAEKTARIQAEKQKSEEKEHDRPAIPARLRNLDIYAEITNCDPDDLTALRTELIGRHGITLQNLDTSLHNTRSQIREAIEVIEVMHEAAAAFRRRYDGGSARDAIACVSDSRDIEMLCLLPPSRPDDWWRDTGLAREAAKTGGDSGLARFRRNLMLMCEFISELGTAQWEIEEPGKTGGFNRRCELVEWLFEKSSMLAAQAVARATTK